MSAIVINFIVKEGDARYLSKNIQTCIDQNVDYRVFDYRIDKDDEFSGYLVENFQFEEYENRRDHIVEFLTNNNYRFFANVSESVRLHANWIDYLVEYLSSHEIGSIYSDFYLLLGDHEVPIMNTSMPSAHNSFPFIIMSSRDYCSKFLKSDEPESLVISECISIHVPEFLCGLLNG